MINSIKHNSIYILSILFGLFIILLGAFFSNLYLTSDVIHPFQKYVSNIYINKILHIQMYIYLFFSIYYIVLPLFHLLKIIDIKLFCNMKYHLIFNIIWMLLHFVTKTYEYYYRSTFYYGEVSDKHGDIGIITGMSYPLIYLLYFSYIFTKERKEKNRKME